MTYLGRENSYNKIHLTFELRSTHFRFSVPVLNSCWAKTINCSTRNDFGNFFLYDIPPCSGEKISRAENNY
jgi:hypothetical protein